MTQLFSRVQGIGYSLEQMQSYQSIHGWDEEAGDYLRVDGLACCNGIPGNTGFGGTGGGFDGIHEVVIFYGHWIENIYDGCVAYPVEIAARFTPSEFERLLESGDIDEMFPEEK